MKKINLKYDYYIWLCHQVGVKYNKKGYENLLIVLYEKEFSWSVANDDNRAFDAKALRSEFCKVRGIEYDEKMFKNTANIFELLVGISHRIDMTMAENENTQDMQMRDWFWKLLDNLGLLEYDDLMHGSTWDKYIVIDKLDVFINRTYERNGKGGLFPLKYCRKDQRKVEIWYQMCLYLLENYYKEKIENPKK